MKNVAVAGRLDKPLAGAKGWHRVEFWVRLPANAVLAITKDGKVTVGEISELSVYSDDPENQVLYIPLTKFKETE